MEGVLSFKGVYPQIADDVYIAPGAIVIGDVVVGSKSSIWFYTIVRGDVNFIRIGEETNIQDHSMLHVTTDTFPLYIGNRVTVGHRAVIHGCTIGDECLIGMGAIILDGAKIGKHSIVAAGAVVPPETEVPERSLVMGIPGKVQKQLSDEEVDRIIETAKHYVRLAGEYMKPKYLESDKIIRGFVR
ncbi:MAG: gamma carbonic anhydrase family protein [Thermodesulforhabdaceae bacterium]|jgi:carbonic anhydrase/acetyltransferase-like protein (isoleucine patch superfamily)